MTPLGPVDVLGVPDARLRLFDRAGSAASDVAALAGNPSLTVRCLRGIKMRAYADLMTEFSAALQLPTYFGGNWDALDECLSDLDWFLPTTAIILRIDAPEQVLIDEEESDLRILVGIMRRAQAEFAASVDAGEQWDRPAIPFFTVLESSADKLDVVERRWVPAGAALVRR